MRLLKQEQLTQKLYWKWKYRNLRNNNNINLPELLSQIPWNKWLKNRICFLTILEVWSLRSSCLWDWFLLRYLPWLLEGHLVSSHDPLSILLVFVFLERKQSYRIIAYFNVLILNCLCFYGLFKWSHILRS